MSFKNDRTKRKKALNFINKIKIKLASFWFSDLTILIWLFLVVFSMFIPWFTLPYGELTQGIFSKMNWIVWYFSVILIILNLFTIFSIQKKEKIKLYFNQKITDNSIYFFSSIIFLILGFNSLITIKWLDILNKDIVYHNWITFYIIASILFSTWVFFKIRKKEKLTLVSLNESEEEQKIKTQKKWNVIALPFE